MNLHVTVGRYTIIENDTGKVCCERDGVLWRDFIGDALTLELACEVEDLRDQIVSLRSQLLEAQA